MPVKYTFPIFLILTLLCGSFFATIVDHCENNEPFPEIVDIMDCDEAPCPLVRGTNVTVDVMFYSPRYVDNITVEAVATALGTELNFPLGNQAIGCDHLMNTRCPIVENEYVQYRLLMPVENYPKVSLTIEFDMYDQDGEFVTCFSIGCKVY